MNDNFDKILETSDYEEIIPSNENQVFLQTPTLKIASVDEWSGILYNIPEFPFKSDLGLKMKIQDTLESYIDSIFTDTFLVYLCKQINKRLKRNLDKAPASNKNNTIIPVIPEEIRKYIAIVLYMDICVLPEIKMYWESNDMTIFGQKFVQNLTTYKRFTQINTNLSLTRINKEDSDKNRDIDSSTAKIIQYLNNLFNSLYSPGENLCLDEGMCKFQGRYCLKTYMPAKPIKIGMKFYILADSKASFVCNFSLYTGKSSSISQIVKKLTENRIHLNHKLYMDNFYNSFKLCKEMRELGVFCCGTMRINRGEPEIYKEM